MVADSAAMKIIISDESHPHAGETGVLTGDVIIVLGKPMAHVLLDNYSHGVDGCYVSKGQIAEVKMHRAKRRNRKLPPGDYVMMPE